MGKIVGIDLGTTNSSVAVVDGNQPVILPNAWGKALTPSAVRFLETGEAIVGEAAMRSRVLEPECTITGIKRFIGRRYNEVFDLARRVPYRVVPGTGGLAMIDVQGKLYSPQEISALILMSLKAAAEAYLGEEVTEAVITTPAYFSDAQKQATKDAGRIAGLEVKRIVSEPTAAALAYGLDRKHDQKIVVFDLGGGTLDISALESGEGVEEVKGISGNGFLGGDDFDHKLATWIREELRYAHGPDVILSPVTLQRIEQAAVEAKIQLTEMTKTDVQLPYVAQRGGSSVNFKLSVSRQRFEERCAELYDGLAEPCRRAMRNAGWSKADIDHVILVGGATRMPRIRAEVEHIFGRAASHFVNPDEAVALGAAIQGGVLAGAVSEILLLDVYPPGLGVEDYRGHLQTIVDPNTTVPTRKSEVFSTCLDGQTSVEIHILAGNHRLAVDNRSLGRMKLENLPAARRGIPQIEITFDIDANQVVDVAAKDRESGREQKVRLRTSLDLEASDLEEMAANLPELKVF